MLWLPPSRNRKQPQEKRCFNKSFLFMVCQPIGTEIDSRTMPSLIKSFAKAITYLMSDFDRILVFPGDLFQGNRVGQPIGKNHLIYIYAYTDNGPGPIRFQVVGSDHGFNKYTPCLSVLPINVIGPFDGSIIPCIFSKNIGYRNRGNGA